ncbi:cation diffusion facilitator family transporter [Methylorubrum rhodesianum]|jgi:cobalt-zinc-cadmium efflux system protein|uniref:Cation diffusion facilitator family transporter n=1 Tax=Methylorubrum rhodesianum TaxID=29427 RepID=A0ABU9Z981_9HYPH|nr:MULTISPECIES: cation diffusion facilitator family transporter [Methylorubrum]MBB5762581.1 cobalt-zinc-cadmium efflux system protein [Methylorubrum rhodesianum]MBI1688582.1 cation transporter [Methylorubrum sp. DB1722]MBK3402375.1 cation transporter [Methylorubrum rhodesianum]MBY0142476.1 cation transporter [Methylorubrum populi]
MDDHRQDHRDNHAHPDHGHDHAGHGHRQEHSHAHAHGGHGHGGDGHVHAPKNFGPAFAIGIALNLGFVGVEALYGWLSNSMALVADAGHNLSDVLGLVAAWIAAVLVKRAPSARFTYGLRGSSILAALFNAVVLLVATGGIIVEAVQRFLEPAPVAGTTVMVVAGIGILINGFTAWLFASGAGGDINIRGAYLHMVADAAVSAGVVLAGLVILATGFDWLDPLVSLVIAALIIVATWGLLRDSVAMSLAAVPPGIDPEAVRACLAARPGVRGLHDLHIWPMSTTEPALTAHLVVAGEANHGLFLKETADELRQRFGIGHATLQIEVEGETACTLPRGCVA